MIHKFEAFQMFMEFSRLLSTIVAMALLAWHSGTYVRLFGFEAGKKIFFLRYTALFRSPGSENPGAIRRRTGSLSLK